MDLGLLSALYNGCGKPFLDNFQTASSPQLHSLNTWPWEGDSSVACYHGLFLDCFIFPKQVRDIVCNL